MPTIDIINELEQTHNDHIKKLESLHEQEIGSLRKDLEETRKKLKGAEEDKFKQDEEIEGMRVEIQMIRQSFNLVQERLKKVLIHQDDLINVIQLLGVENTAEENTAEENNNLNTKKNTKSIQKVEDQSNLEMETLKYFKKIESSDPLNLSKLLDIPFCPDRSINLSNSLISAISIHLNRTETEQNDNNNTQFSINRTLLNEILKIKQDLNDLCRIYFNLLSKYDQKHKNQLLKRLTETGNSNTSLSKYLIDETKATDHENSETTTSDWLISTFLSKFK